MAFKMDLGALGSKKLAKKDNTAVTDIQASTFTAWFNMQLRTANPKHSDIKHAQLGSSLRSGVFLIEMLQVVTKKKISKWKPTPRGKMQEIENLNIAFAFMEEQGTKFENIGSLDVWDGNKTLILGLLWTIIYNFQIVDGTHAGLNAKAELLHWLQAKIPEFGIKNLVDDWRDGLALAALVNALGKDFMLGSLVGGAELMKAEKATDNLDKVMDIAEKRLCVGRILTPKQMQDPACGEKSMMCYLSLFTKAKEPEKEATPLKKVALFSPPKAAALVKPDVAAEADPILLQKINHLFAAMDTDANGAVSKFELIDFVQLNAPISVTGNIPLTVAEVMKILSLDKHHEISKVDFVEVFLAGTLDVNEFPLIKEHLGIIVPVSAATELKGGLNVTPKKVITKGFDPARAQSTEPPLERDPEWRVYEGHDLGGRCRIKVYFSTTTSSAKVRGNTEQMKSLLERKNYHNRPDFEPMTPVDMDMEKSFRDKIFEKAGTRVTPMLFVDDEFIGGYQKCADLDEAGELDLIFAY